MDITAERIKNRRLALGMSQDELAQKCGYKSRSSINKIENNAGKVPMRKIQVLAKALNTNPDYLMGWNDDDSDETDIEKVRSAGIREEFRRDFGNRVKERRQALNMTQEELAYKMGFKAKQSISMIERGERSIDHSQLKELSIHLRCSIDYLMGWDVSDEKEAIISNISSEVSEMNEAQLSRLLKYAELINKGEL